MTSGTEHLLGARRQEELLAYLRTRGTQPITEISRIFGVSASTVRRDLNALQEDGLVERVHGGASPIIDGTEARQPFRRISYAEEKSRIGKAAARHVTDNSTILVLGGTTTEAMLPFLSGKTGLTVITNNLTIANGVAPHPGITVAVLGGVLRKDEMSLLGHLTILGAAEFSFSQIFSSAFGVHPATGVSGADLMETQTDRSLTSAASELVILADHSKLGKQGAAKLVKTDAMSTLITDDGADPDLVQQFRTAGVTVELC